MKKYITLIIVVVVILAVIIAAWYSAPKMFLKDVLPSEVTRISVFNGNTGKSFVITDFDEISTVVTNISSAEMKRDGISSGYDGYGFCLSFEDSNGNEIETLIINSEDTVRKDPFFYRTSGGLCYDYMQELEEKYAPEQ